MAKILRNGLNMIEMNPLNHKWLDFVILTGLVLHQFQTKWLLKYHGKLQTRKLGQAPITVVPNPQTCVIISPAQNFGLPILIWKPTLCSLTSESHCCSSRGLCTANIYSGKWDTRKKCKSYKYLPQILQCRSVDITVNHCKSVFTFFHCNWSSGTM